MNWVNLWSEDDWIVRYLLRLWNPNVDPIGGNCVGTIKGHTVSDVDMTGIVSGHSNYKDHLYAIAKMSSILHD